MFSQILQTKFEHLASFSSLFSSLFGLECKINIIFVVVWCCYLEIETINKIVKNKNKFRRRVQFAFLLLNFIRVSDSSNLLENIYVARIWSNIEILLLIHYDNICLDNRILFIMLNVVPVGACNLTIIKNQINMAEYYFDDFHFGKNFLFGKLCPWDLYIFKDKLVDLMSKNRTSIL